MVQFLGQETDIMGERQFKFGIVSDEFGLQSCNMMFFISAGYKATIDTESWINGILALAMIDGKGLVKLLYQKGRMYNGWVSSQYINKQNR